jgi:hypothetical protein
MTSIVERVDAYEVEPSDLVVASCQREPAGLRLELHSANTIWTITIEGSFSIRHGSGSNHVWATPDISELLGESVHLIRARKSNGELHVQVGRDWIITVEPDDSYEAWQIYSSNGERLIAVPGNGVAVWTGVNEAMS